MILLWQLEQSMTDLYILFISFIMTLNNTLLNQSFYDCLSLKEGNGPEGCDWDLLLALGFQCLSVPWVVKRKIHCFSEGPGRKGIDKVSSWKISA